MTNVIANLLNALTDVLDTASDSHSNITGPIDRSVTINIGQGSESSRSVQFVIDKNTTLTSPNVLGPIAFALISRVTNLRKGQDGSVQIDVLSGSAESQAPRRTTFSLQRSTIPQLQIVEMDTGLAPSGGSVPANSGVRGIARRMIQGLRNHVK
ncbi:MAG TPA: hypothetical protein GX523_06820 [Desulfitobacterium dehalogenans]|uniref:Uncharacterized protein n=1 Tax=Desulfitobacterium dehalogenans TaxID=36854 RepID=A0A7C6Z3P7_9FIRM|nr:hypothetical protein [Desulfitobacterium dehalogenans]